MAAKRHLQLVPRDCEHPAARVKSSGRVYCPDCTASWPFRAGTDSAEFDQAIQVLLDQGLLIDDYGKDASHG